jgi:hypothetical protein
MSPAYPAPKPVYHAPILSVCGAALLLLQLFAAAAGAPGGECLSVAVLLLIALL